MKQEEKTQKHKTSHAIEPWLWTRISASGVPERTEILLHTHDVKEEEMEEILGD